MRALLGASFAVLLTVGTAQSADIFGDTSVYRLLNGTPVANWTGPYLGLTLGYGWADLEATRAFADVTGVGSGSLPLTGFVTSEDSVSGGVTIGYNFYASNLVFGLEADASYGDHEFNSGTLSATDVFSVGDTLSGSFDAGFQYFGTLRGRLGLVLWPPRMMLYGTGGLALASTEASINFSYDDGTGPISGSFSDRNVSVGWTAGAGIEDRFTERLSLKLEYLYVSLPEDTFEFSRPGVSVGFDGKTDMHMVRAGLNYHY